MSAVELLYGERDAASVATPATLTAAPGGDIVLSDCEILYCLFELPMAAARARLPRSLHPSIPAIVGITAMNVTDGPAGPFVCAWTGLSCRTGIKPRHFVTGAFASTPAAVDLLRGRYGFPCELAGVSYCETYDRVRATVDRDGRAVLDVQITGCVPLLGSGATVKYSPPLTAALIEGEPSLIQFEASYDFKRVLRGRPAAAVFDAAALGDAAVAPHYPVAGTHARCDVTLHPVRFRVDLERPAEAGGASRIDAAR